MSCFLAFLEQYLYFSSLIILVLGIPGNVLLFVMYTYRKRLRSLSFALYFRLIALVDLFITLNWIKIFIRYRHGDYFIEDESVFLCKMVSYAIYCAGPISSWHLIAIAIDRLVAIMYPRRFLFLLKRSFQIVVSITIFVLNMIYYIGLLINFDLVDVSFNQATSNSNYDQSINDSVDLVYTANLECSMDFRLLYWLDLINSCALPFVFMIVTTWVTIRFMVKTRGRSNIVFPGAGGGLRGGSCGRRSLSRDARFSLTSISLNILFLILNLPHQVFALYTYTSRNDDLDSSDETSTTATIEWEKLVGFSFLALFYANHAIGFYVQIAFNGIFRRESRKLLRSFTRIAQLAIFSSLPKIRKSPLDLSLTSLPQ